MHHQWESSQGNPPDNYNPNGSSQTYNMQMQRNAVPVYIVTQTQPTLHLVQYNPYDQNLYFALQQQNASLQQQNASLQQQNASLQQHNASLQQHNASLQQQLSYKDNELHRAIQEIQRLNASLGIMRANETKLAQENRILKSEKASSLQINEELKAGKARVLLENAALKQQITETQPVSYNEDTNQLSLLSSAVSITVDRPGAFENFVLSLPALSSADFKTPIDLPPLRFRLEAEYNSSEYFQQFIPYIKEEIRASIAGQIEKISTQQLRPFTASFDPAKKLIAGEYAFNLKCHTQELPKLDHAFQQEAVFVVIKKPHHTSKWDAQEPLQGFLAIASSIPRKNQMETHEQKEIVFSLTLLKDQYEQYAQYWQNQENTLEIHWVHGLIPAARDYQACINPRKISLARQIIRGNLPAWPAMSSNTNTLSDSSPYTSQNEVVDSLERVHSGMYCLQGPPGTGKTSTVVNVLGRWINQHPDDPILLCAPSNPAVQVVFERSQAQFPDVCMALLINSETTSDVCVNNYGANLYHPLYDLHASKDISAVELKTKVLLEYERIFQKLHGLNQHKRKNFVKLLVQKKIEELELYFFEKIRSLNHEGSSFDIPNLHKNLEDSIEHLKNNAHFIEYFLVQRAQIVFATLTGSGRDFLKRQIPHFRFVIIDEASQATIPTTLIPIVLYNPEVCFLVGDQRQLRATTISNNAQNGDYGTSLFSSFVEGPQLEPYKMLTNQFRMHQDMCLLPSRQYYGGALETDISVFERRALFQPHPKTLFRFPTLFFNIKGKEIRQGHSFINEKEAEAIVATTIYLLQCGIKSGQIGIITFYAAQVSRILEGLKRRLKVIPAGLTVSTVDSFQGDERDIILISTVRTKEDIGFLKDPHRINVSLTRAKYNLCLFANGKSILQSNSDLAQYPEHATIAQEKDLFTEINSRVLPRV